VPAIEELSGGSVDLVVANAGLWPQRHALSKQGHEAAFATNALGHHGPVRALEESGLLANDATVVLMTGDIYIMASACDQIRPHISLDYRPPAPAGLI